MKKIILSLAVVAAAAAIIIGGSIAYFSDTETSVGNTFTAGTIDISINNQNPWSESYSIGDLKPGETDYMTFNIRNVGQNPVNISKRVYDFVGTGGDNSFCGVSSESEFDAEGGKYYSTGSCNKKDWVPEDRIHRKIYYDLSVEVWKGGQKIWWQTIETGDNRLVDVYSSGKYVDLGMLPVGARMFVKQSYHLDADTDNRYQGDTATFSMEIRGEQLAEGDNGLASVVLENKDGAPDWNILDDDIGGVLTYNTKGSTFDFSFMGTVTQSSEKYMLLYAVDPWPQTNSIELGTTMSDDSGYVDFSGTATPGSITNGKVWLVLSADWDGRIMTAWNETDYLFETGLINYEQN